ncbi:EspA/EspE family type VII secretion system effector [Mycobacterium sp. AT1]|uniref:TPR repeat region-containing protein n=1 Tax=Mycobacterium sp. AT1 TaxID=1961706 RepID=UPI0009AE1ED2|nr:EspA/EspE family type VII secretion system effector [Mycobacterium sp. AT1]OPX05712.1 hypothetical protein B1790_31015 [Mycobacterium sp. AT1]
MGVLDGFISTWSNARETFGQGVPATGEQFDKSGPLTTMQSNVESAAPGSRWTGAGASAYQTANADHGKVFAQLAALDKQLSSHVTASSEVVAAGRQNLDTIRKWVVDGAAAVPPGKNHDQMVMQIVNKGLGQLREVVTKSNADLATIGGKIRGLGGEYDALGNQKFAPKEGVGDGVLGDDKGKDEEVKDDKPTPEQMEELVHKAVAEGDPVAAAKVDELLNGIKGEQLGPNSAQHPLDPVQAELIGQMQAQMKPMSMDDLNAARDRLGPNKDILSNAMQVMSDPDVTYPRHDGDGPQIVSSEPGGPLPNDGVLPGDTGALPDGVQATLNQRGDFMGPPDPSAGYPGTQTDFEGGARHEAAENLKNLANIVGDGDPRFQQGSQLDREMMSNAKEWLSAQESPDGRSQEHWGDEVVERVFDTAGRDTVVNHDMFTTDKEFTHDVLTHEWQDNGESARTLTDWINRDALSSDPMVNQRAGETASALADYLGDPANKDSLMNISTGSEPNMSIGKMNPELTQSLAHAMSPYVDEMAGRNIDGSSGWHSIDNPDTDRSFPHATNVMGVLGTDPDAAKILDTRSASVQGGYINEYANSVIDSGGHSSDSGALEAAGRLKGITAEGAFIAASDVTSDASEARKAAWDRLSTNYDAAVGLAGAIPHAGPALELQSTLMKDAILGPRPGDVDPGHTPIEGSLGMKSALASTFIAHGIGDPGDIAQMRPYDSDGDGQIEIPAYNEYDQAREAYLRHLSDYFNRLDPVINNPLAGYDQAYRDVLK